jgi:hypothetical protein
MTFSPIVRPARPNPRWELRLGMLEYDPHRPQTNRGFYSRVRHLHVVPALRPPRLSRVLKVAAALAETGADDRRATRGTASRLALITNDQPTIANYSEDRQGGRLWHAVCR